jgi:hypothetical protein
MEKDIDKKRRYWVEIDSKERPNKAFEYNETGFALIDVLIQGVKDGKLVAYSAVDDRFTKALTIDQFNELLMTTYLAARLIDNKGKEIIYKSGSSQFRPAKVSKFRIKEDSLHLKNGTSTVRLLGIAPMVELVNDKGKPEEQPFFWIYYPDALNYLGTIKANNTEPTWADVIEDQQFTGKIIKEAKAK